MDRYTLPFQFLNGKMIATVEGEPNMQYHALWFIASGFSKETVITGIAINDQPELLGTVFLSELTKAGYRLALPIIKQKDRIEVSFKGKIAGLALYMKEA